MKKILYSTIIMLFIAFFSPVTINGAGDDLKQAKSKLITKVMENNLTVISYSDLKDNSGNNIIKGNGTSNDFQGIKAVHEAANDLYLKGYPVTVQAESGKVYYIKETGGEYIPVTTDVDWKAAKFIIDDTIFINEQEKGFGNSIFQVVSPYRVSSGDLMLSLPKESFSSFLSTSNSFRKDSKTLDEDFINEVMKEAGARASFFEASQLWGVEIIDGSGNNVFIRQGENGANKDDGRAKADTIIIKPTSINNRKIGEIISPILFDYDKVSTINVWPIPDNSITIKNATFITKAFTPFSTTQNNKIYEDKRVLRGIKIALTGNVTLENINHNLQDNGYASSYYGFINLDRAYGVNLNKIKLSPHVPGKDASGTYEGTYDLVIEKSNNIFLNEISYSQDSSNCIEGNCYKEYMVNPKRWGVMSSNESKNLSITNSRMNRVDAHRAVYNLHVKGTDTDLSKTNCKIGDKGVMVTGYGDLLIENCIFDKKYSNTKDSHMISLRNDYGATFDGNVYLKNNKYILNDSISPSSSYYKIIDARNSGSHWFGYKTIFPRLYIDELTIDYNKYPTNKPFVMLDLTNVVDNPKQAEKYGFKGNVNLRNITSSRNIQLFNDSFVSNINNFNNSFYNNAPQKTIISSFDNPSKISFPSINSSQNTNFTFKPNTTGDVFSSALKNVNNNLSNSIKTSQHPEFQSSQVTLSNTTNNTNSLIISAGTFKEAISPSRYKYTAIIPDTVNSNITITAIGNSHSILKDNKTQVEFSPPNQGESKVVNVIIPGYKTKATYKITVYRQKNVSNLTISNIQDVTYTGQKITPKPIIKDNTKLLTEGIDYELSYSNNINVGTATIAIKGINNYSGTLNKSFAITHKVITIPEGKTNLVYNYKSQTGVPTSPDYTISGNVSTNAANYTATLKLKDTKNHKWSDGSTSNKSISWKINPKNIKNFTIEFINDKIYNGEPQTQSLVLKDGTNTLNNNSDFTISYKDNINAGTATMIISGKGNFTGVINKSFLISQASIIDSEVSNIHNALYTGLNITQNPTLKLDNKILQSNIDYSIEYENNLTAGTASIILTGKGNYKDSITKTFEISPSTVSLPSSINNLIYDGNIKIGIPSNPLYNIENGTGVSAGTYEATVSLNDKINYIWDDKTNVDKSLLWTINKATPILNIPNKLVLNVGDKYLAEVSSVDEIAGGFTYSSDNNSILRLETVSENKVNLFALNEGTANITVTFVPENNNYNSIELSFEVKINKAENKYTIFISSKGSHDVIYNGKEHTVNNILTGTNPVINGRTYHVEGLTSSGISERNAGKYFNKISGTPKVIDEAQNDVTDLFDIVLEEGSLTIKPQPLIIKGSNSKVEYDETTISGDSSYTIIGLLGEDTADILYTPPFGYDIGIYDNGYFDLSSFKSFNNGIDTTSNYVISSTISGLLEIVPKNSKEYIVITGESYEGEYDGQEHTVNSFTSNLNEDKYTISGIEYSATGKNVLDSISNIPFNGNPIITNKDGKDVTSLFDISLISGSLVINKANLLLESGSFSDEFNNQTISNNDVLNKNPNGLIKEIGWVDNEGASYIFENTLSRPGTIENRFTIVPNHNTNLDNYNIYKSFGQLELIEPTSPSDDPQPPKDLYQVSYQYISDFEIPEIINQTLPNIEFTDNIEEFTPTQPNFTSFEINGFLWTFSGFTNDTQIINNNIIFTGVWTKEKINTDEYVNLSIEKIWKDSDGNIIDWPSSVNSVTITINYKNETKEESETIVLYEDNSSVYSKDFVKIPNGYFQISEVVIDGYETNIIQKDVSSFSIISKRIEEDSLLNSDIIAIVKLWDDNNNKNIRPTQISFEIKDSQGNLYDNIGVISKENQFSYNELVDYLNAFYESNKSSFSDEEVLRFNHNLEIIKEYTSVLMDKYSELDLWFDVYLLNYEGDIKSFAVAESDINNYSEITEDPYTTEGLSVFTFINKYEHLQPTEEYYYDVNFIKIDSSGNRVNGHVANIKDSTGKIISSFKFENQGFYKLSLKPGDYIYSEISSPEEYQTTKSFIFSITNEGHLIISTSNDDVYCHDLNSLIISSTKTNPNIPTDNDDNNQETNIENNTQSSVNSESTETINNPAKNNQDTNIVQKTSVNTGFINNYILYLCLLSISVIMLISTIILKK